MKFNCVTHNNLYFSYKILPVSKIQFGNREKKKFTLSDKNWQENSQKISNADFGI